MLKRLQRVVYFQIQLFNILNSSSDGYLRLELFYEKKMLLIIYLTEHYDLVVKDLFKYIFNKSNKKLINTKEIKSKIFGLHSIL